MKKRVAIILILAIFILASIGYYSIKYNPSLTGNTVFNYPGDLNCTNESIRATWDSAFKTSFADLKIFVNESDGSCLNFIAYKNRSNEFYVLAGFKIYLDLSGIESSFTFLSAHKSNVTSTYASSLIGNPLSTNYTPLTSLGDYFVNITPITNAPSADSEFRAVFEPIPGPLITMPSNEGTVVYSFSENTTSNRSSSVLTGVISANYSLVQFVFTNVTLSNCTANWVPRNTSCNATTSTLTSWFNDSNNCKVRLPSNNYTAPPNLTLSCSVPNYTTKLYGNQNSVNKINIANLSLYINNSLLNNSQIYHDNLLLEFKENATSLIRLTYNFSQTLNLSDVRVEKQNSSSLFGYIIIAGLDVAKTIYVDKINLASNAVCIKDARVSAISEVSSSCNAANEVVVLCPGTNSSYTCSISSSRFSVSGVSHSAAMEFSQPSTPAQNICTSNWTCTPWSVCITGNQIRTCVDTNACQNATNRPLELQTCISACAPNWACGNWSKCSSNGNQSRICRDSNNCGISDGKPSELQICNSRSSNNSKSIVPQLVLGFIIFIILAAIIALVIYLIKTNRRDGRQHSPSSRLGPVTPPGTDQFS